MAIKTAKKTKETVEAVEEKTQIKLLPQKPAQRRIEMGELLVQAQLKQIEREKVLGQAKTIKNEIDEMMEKAKMIARETVTGQLKLAVEEVFVGDDDDDEDDLDGRVMDQSNVKTPEEMRPKGEFTQSLEDSLNDAASDDTDSESEGENNDD